MSNENTMRNFYKIVKESLHFNRFELGDTVCLEYACPLDGAQVGIFSKCDYIAHVLSGKKSWKSINGQWTLSAGSTLYLKKGATVVHQYFDDDFCMLGFFISDALIAETMAGLKGEMPLVNHQVAHHFTATEVKKSSFLDDYFQSMLMYFRSASKPPEAIIKLKLQELLVSIVNSDPLLGAYFNSLTPMSKPSLVSIMEANFCYNLKMEAFAELTHRSLSSFKRDFQNHYNETPGRWLLQKRLSFAANLLLNSDENITQIAFESGFEDVSHFSRAFKQKMGLSPSDFRNTRAFPSV
ncbi:MAG: helix-turn-helix transcriptional regulator [Lewinellaceae bacterium]|nr:helix-turn-helix transcriptional regulator [Lewinellaceae bacterium]